MLLCAVLLPIPSTCDVDKKITDIVARVIGGE